MQTSATPKSWQHLELLSGFIRVLLSLALVDSGHFTLLTPHLLSTSAANLPQLLPGNNALHGSPPLHTLTYTLPHLFLVSACPAQDPFHASVPLLWSDTFLNQSSGSFSLLACTSLHLNVCKDSLLKRKYPLTATKIPHSLPLPVH